MNLPPAPDKYQLRDQDQLRKILGEGLNDTVSRIISLEQAPAVVTPPPGDGSTKLRLGWANYGLNVGTGPGLSSTNPWTFSQQLSVSTTQINQYIALADAADVWFMFGPSGGRGGYLDADGHFSRTLYESKVRRYEDNDVLRDAIDRKRVLLWVTDEANHPSFHGTYNPDDVNWGANLHKAIWPGALTFVRMGTSTLLTGWNGHGIPAGGWTGIDYAWEQRSGQHNSEQFSTFYSTRKAELADLEMGMIPGLNWDAGGVMPGQVLSGVGPCWDVNADNSLNGIIIGANNNGVDHNDFDRVACNDFGDAKRALVSPALLEAWAKVVAADTDAPFSMMWQWPTNGSLGPASTAAAETLLARSDYITAMTNALATANARASWSGWRTAKPGDPI